ncbi:MAG TPA: LacI family DNA-binding transcriptional regulator [Thermoanaerobaculia bacterium]|nr:LacI family DNA-binding transcriptional regulator [Thermoanaerobaculia bacterium]
MSIPLHQPGGAAAHGATIKDVAGRADVSVATVSRVLNEKGLVRQETVKRVLDAARELNYVPHGGARSLSMRRTSTVGVVLPDLHGEFFSEVIRGIDVASRRRGYHLLVSGSHSDWSEMVAVLIAVRGRVDGLIVMAPELESGQVPSRLPAGIPVVLLNCRAPGTWSIAIDNTSGSRTMMQHLFGLGHREVAFVAGPEGNSDAAERLRGWRDSMAAAGVGNLEGLRIEGDFSENAGYEAGYALLSRGRRPTAVFAANDAMAIGALCALREQGVKVPEEMAVVGFDDIPIARFVSPPLSTVSVEIAELGRRAFELFLEATEPGRQPRLDTVPTHLVIRESCGSRARAPDSERFEPTSHPQEPIEQEELR